MVLPELEPPVLPDVPDPLEPEPDEPIEPEEPVEPEDPEELPLAEPLVLGLLPALGEELLAEPPIVVPDELGVEALELELEPGAVLVCDPVAPEPALSPPLPQADRDITAAAITARVAPREKEETFMLNSLVGIVRGGSERDMTAGSV